MTADSETSARRAAVAALRNATQFALSEDLLRESTTAEPTLLRDSDRIAHLEGHIRAVLFERAPLGPRWRAACLPVLGNIAEAALESSLTELGWQPYYDDDSGESHTRGVDLLMLDPSVERVVAIEVKSTIQVGRWPRLSRHAQMSTAWLDSPSNPGMSGYDLDSRDVYRMIAQVHLARRRWRTCILASEAIPIIDLAQLADLTWLHP